MAARVAASTTATACWGEGSIIFDSVHDKPPIKEIKDYTRTRS